MAMKGSFDYILKHDGIGKVGFLKHIIAEGIARQKRKPFIMKFHCRLRHLCKP